MNISVGNSRDLLASFKKVTNKHDLDKVVQITDSIWNEYYIPIFGKDQVDYMLHNVFTRKALLAKIKHEGLQYFLIEYASKDIGYLGLKIREEDVLITNLYLSPKHRGLSIGRKAVTMAQAIAKKKGKKVITARVHKENLESIIACYRLGFEKTGEVCRSVGGAYVMDDLVMQTSVD